MRPIQTGNRLSRQEDSLPFLLEFEMIAGVSGRPGLLTLLFPPAGSRGCRNNIAPSQSSLLLCAVPRFRSLSRYWLPVLIWMCVIFSASSDRMSMAHSSRIITPIVRWLFPHFSDQAVEEAVFYGRKFAHVAEYAILALLVWRALHNPGRSDPHPWSWPEAARAALLVLLYAAADEFHQSFVPSRDASLRDVLLDTSGAILALLFLWGLGRWRRRRRALQSSP